MLSSSVLGIVLSTDQRQGMDVLGCSMAYCRGQNAAQGEPTHV